MALEQHVGENIIGTLIKVKNNYLYYISVRPIVVSNRISLNVTHNKQ